MTLRCPTQCNRTEEYNQFLEPAMFIDINNQIYGFSFETPRELEIVQKISVTGQDIYTYNHSAMDQIHD